MPTVTRGTVRLTGDLLFDDTFFLFFEHPQSLPVSSKAATAPVNDANIMDDGFILFEKMNSVWL